MPIVSLSTPPPPPTTDNRHNTQGLDPVGLAVSEGPLQADPIYKYPIVRLDTDVISDELAARLATSFLGHILFLKSQVPFPIMQLSRIPGGKSSARATKQRGDLLQSFDTLISHLSTTFTALSTALARCSSDGQMVRKQPHRGRAYVAFLVGPSMGSAKSKVIYAVDGLEVKVWGSRDDTAERKKEKESEAVEEEDGDDYGDEEDDDEAATDSEGSSSAENSSSGGEEDDAEPPNEGSDEDEGPTPPPSRSPSPPPLDTSHAEQQKALNAADRLLSRTLAMADADGHGMAAEISPTQTHILIRAPRRFNHPAWIPRQNLTVSLDGALADFLKDSGPSTQGDKVQKRKTQKGKAIEGVWITCRDGLQRQEITETPDVEEDEMIWWSWDGKIVGFSEW